MNRRAQVSWTAGARSETGYVRSENEDRMSRVRFHGGEAYIVSDGIGGHSDGARAAELTVRTLEQHLSAIQDETAIGKTLKDAFAAANATVYAAGHLEESQSAAMGATALVCVTSRSGLLVAHVGDSRAYLHRHRHLTRLTKDHTRAQSMVDAGILSPSEADKHPDARILNRAIGHAATVETDMTDWLQLRSGDEILMCTDGLSGEVDDPEIEEALRPNESPRRLVDRLIVLALEKGGHDNVTVQLIRYGDRTTPFNWKALSPGLTALVIVALGCALTISYVRRSETALSQQLTLMQSETRSLRSSAEQWRHESSQELHAIKQQLAEINTKLEHSSSTPAPAATAPPVTTARRSAVMNRKPARKKTSSGANPDTTPVQASQKAPTPPPTPTPNEGDPQSR